MTYSQLADAAWLERRYVRDGAPVTDLADEIGCEVSSLHLALRRHGIPPRTVHQIRRAQVERMLDRGRTPAEIARALEVDSAVLYDRLYRWGLRIPAAEGYDLRTLRKWYASGRSIRSIAAEFGVAPRTATRLLLAAGVEIRPRGRQKRAHPIGTPRARSA